MITACARVAPLASSDQVDSGSLYAFLMACVTADDHVEHLRVRAGPTVDGPTSHAPHLDVLAFLDLTDPQRADEILARLVRRAIARTPALRLWRVL